MRRALPRTAWANVASRPLQSALIALIVLAAAASLTLALNVRGGATEPFERNFRATDSAHVWVRSDDRAALRRVPRLPGVRRATRPYPVVDAAAVIRGRRDDLKLVGVPGRPLPFDRPRLTAGRWVRPGERALVVENSFARAFGVRTGDRVRIPRPGRDDVVLRVAGVAVSASQGPAPDWSPSAAWIPRDVLRDEAPRATLDGEVAVQLADRDESAAFVERVRRLLPPDRARVTEWREIRAAVTARTDSSRAVLQASSVFALIAVGLIVANAIAGRVLAQRRELGILKAVGMTPRGLTSLLLVEHLGLAIVAAVVGTAIGTAMSPLPLRPTARLLGTPTPSPFELRSVIAGTVGIVAVVAAFTVLPVWRAGRVPVAEAVGGARGVREASRSRLARAATRLHLPPAVVLGVKDAFARRTRAVLTVSSLALTMALVGAALSTEATFKRVIDDSALRSKPYDVLVEPARGSDARARALIAGLGDRVRTTYTLAAVPVVMRGEPIQTRAIGGDYRRFHYAIPDGRAIAGPGEAIVGRGLLDHFGLRIGDRLRMRVRGRPVSLRIVGRYVEPDNDGRIAIYDRASLPVPVTALPALAPSYGIAVAPGTDPHAIARSVDRGSRGAVEAEVPKDEILRERDDLRPVVYGTDLVLLVIGFVNLLTTLMLGVRERERDFGVFKVLGLTPRQLLQSVTAGGVLLALFAIAIGTPLGIAIFRALLVSLNPSDGPDIVTAPPWWWIALMVPGAVLLSALASVLPARRAAAVRPAEALRYE
jgi:putative ABC transport system permease protein